MESKWKEPQILEDYEKIYCADENIVRSSYHETRVVYILPGAWDEIVCCKLQVISLDSEPEYEALSYVWGNPSVTIPILLNEVDFHVTTNLGAALKRLRRTDQERVIWIDALCINQMDVEERSAQVKIMGIIFTNCTDCIIWLGDELDPRPPEPDAKPLPWLFEGAVDILDDPRVKDPVFAAFVILYMISKDKHSYETECLVHEKNLINMDKRLAMGQYGLELIVRNEWWNRIWTVQESIVPKRARTVMFGALHISWMMLVEAARAFNNHTSKICCDYNNLEDSLVDLFFEYCQNIVAIQVRWSDLLQGEHDGLLSLLLQFSHRKSSNELDMVFALLGLIELETVDDYVVLNYEQTTKDVYSKLAINLITKEENLSFLEACDVNESGFPSWVVDWRGQSPRGFTSIGRLNRILANSVYTLCKAPRFAATIDCTSLHFRGQKLGSVAYVSRLIDIEFRCQDRLPTCEDILQLVEPAWTPESIYKNSSTWAEAYWRTLISDVVRDQDISDKFGYQRCGPDDFKDAYQTWWSTYMNNVDISDREELQGVLNFAESVTVSHNRRFYVTDNRYLGTGPPEMLPGDEVWGLEGGRIPFILRKCDKERTEASARIGPQFTLIGGCYMHGVMFGELNLREDFQDLVLV